MDFYFKKPAIHWLQTGSAWFKNQNGEKHSGQILKHNKHRPGLEGVDLVAT